MQQLTSTTKQNISTTNLIIITNVSLLILKEIKKDDVMKYAIWVDKLNYINKLFFLFTMTL